MAGHPKLNRRDLIRGAGASLLLGLAGCSTTESGVGPDTTTSTGPEPFSDAPPTTQSSSIFSEVPGFEQASARYQEVFESDTPDAVLQEFRSAGQGDIWGVGTFSEVGFPSSFENNFFVVNLDPLLTCGVVRAPINGLLMVSFGGFDQVAQAIRERRVEPQNSGDDLLLIQYDFGSGVGDLWVGSPMSSLEELITVIVDRSATMSDIRTGETMSCQPEPDARSRTLSG